MRKILVLLLLLVPVPLLAETYQWTDSRGTVNFTEDLGRVPKKYRRKVKLLGQDDAATPGAETAETAKPVARAIEAGTAKKVVYGDKDEKGWRSEFTQLKGDLKLAEQDLTDYRARLGDTSKMTRTEYLNLTSSVKHQEYRVQELRKRLEGLNAAADQAGVPADLR